MKQSNLLVDKDLIQQWVHCYGCSVSEAVLDAEFNYFVVPHIQGFIGYRIKLGYAVVIGDPICEQSKMEELAIAFQQFCDKEQLKVIYMIASKSFAKWAVDNSGGALIEVGDELILNPQIDNKEGPKAYKLRNKINHAIKEGIEVHEYLDRDEKIEQSINQTAEQWLTKRHGPQIYLGPIDFFGNRISKRWFYATQGNTIVGAALLSRLDQRNGYLLKHLIAIPNASRGTSEFIVSSLLETLKKEHCDFVTYGIIPPTHLGETLGLGKLSKYMLKIIFQVFKWTFQLEQRKQYWQQFHPTTEPLYLVFTNPSPVITNLRAAMQALNIDLSGKSWTPKLF